MAGSIRVAGHTIAQHDIVNDKVDIQNATLDSTNTFNFANDSISGDKIDGGTISNATLDSTSTFNGTLGTACDSNFQKINTNYRIQRYFSSISLPNFTWTKLVDVDDAISGYSHSFDFSSSRFIATTYVFGVYPGSGIINWGVEAQNNSTFAVTVLWRSGSGYTTSFRCVYNTATSIELQIKNDTGYGPFTTHAVTEFWYYDY